MIKRKPQDYSQYDGEPCLRFDYNTYMWHDDETCYMSMCGKGSQQADLQATSTYIGILYHDEIQNIVGRIQLP